MLRRWLGRFGLALSLAAYGTLAFHVDHADADHSSPTHHCCPCHAYTAAPNVAAAVPVPQALYASFRLAALSPAPRLALRRDGAPRAPPQA